MAESDADRIQCWSRFKKLIGTANVFSAKIDGTAGMHFTYIIDSMNAMTTGINDDWRNYWSTSSKKTVLQQQKDGMIVCRDLHRAMKCLMDIYQQRLMEFAKAEALALRGRKANQTTIEETIDSVVDSLGASTQPSYSSFPSEVSSFHNEIKEESKGIKEETIDEMTEFDVNSDWRVHSAGQPAVLLQLDDGHPSQVELEDVKPYVSNEFTQMVKAKEEEQNQPLVDRFCPSTGTSRPIELRAVDDRYERNYSDTGKRLLTQSEPTLVRVPYYFKMRQCFLCDQHVNRYLITPLTDIERVIFLNATIVQSSESDRIRMENLKRQGSHVAYFCERHISTCLLDEHPAVKKQRTQDFLRKLKTRVDREEDDKSSTPDSNETEYDLAEPIEEPASTGADAAIKRNPQTKSSSRKCDLCGEFSSYFRYSPSDPAEARKFFIKLINVTSVQRRSTSYFLLNNRRATICTKHVQLAPSFRPHAPRPSESIISNPPKVAIVRLRDDSLPQVTKDLPERGEQNRTV